jgi:hypothetical protein
VFLILVLIIALLVGFPGSCSCERAPGLQVLSAEKERVARLRNWSIQQKNRIFSPARHPDGRNDPRELVPS